MEKTSVSLVLAQQPEPGFLFWDGGMIDTYKIILERHGGIGDTAMVVPIARYLRKHENIIIDANGKPLEIIWSTQKRNWFLLDNLAIGGKKIVNRKIEKFPLQWKLYWKTVEDQNFIAECKKNIASLDFVPDATISFFEAIERCNLSDYKNCYDWHFEWIGIDPETIPVEDKRPYYYVKEAEKKQAEKLFKPCPGSNYLRIGVQMHASSLPRTWDKFDKLLIALCSKYPKAAVYSLGDPVAQILELSPGERPRNYLPLAGRTHGDGRLWGALIADLDLLVTVDSGALHLAGATGVPVVGIFSTVPSWTRMKHFSNSIGIDSKYHCAPCFHIGLECQNSVPVMGKTWKPSLSIRGKNSAYPCLASITVDEVMSAVEQLIGH